MGAPLEVTWREGVGKGRLGESYGGTLRIRKEYKQLPENLSRKGFVPIRGSPHSVT